MFAKGWRDEELSACSELISFGRQIELQQSCYHCCCDDDENEDNDDDNEDNDDEEKWPPADVGMLCNVHVASFFVSLYFVTFSSN